MPDTTNIDLVEEIVKKNRYLTLSTTDGRAPWIAPLEYMFDDELNFYFLSLESSRHAQHLRKNEKVAVAIFDPVQEEYSPDLSITLRGVQIEATARILPRDKYPAVVASAIEALCPPMPPYAVFKIEPVRFYLPTIEKGVNDRIEVERAR